MSGLARWLRCRMLGERSGVDKGGAGNEGLSEVERLRMEVVEVQMRSIR